MVKQNIPETKTTKGPRMLPMVTLSDGKTYFIDDRLKQLRNVNNPHDFINGYECKISLLDLEAVRKQSDDFTQFITVSCPQCGKTLYSGTEQDARHLIIYCTDC